MISLALVFSEIIDFLGADVVSSFFTGRYNKSVVEERIFMFLDMKDSTTIAEKLGHQNHYKFINAYYADMTDAIIETTGQIYQYVGDEIVISWNLKDGIRDGNCLKCFFLIKDKIEQNASFYQNEFGELPASRAGLHFGKVTRGQVGFIKKELLYTGDVLNTTARIQSMCKELNADFLISQSLYDLIPDSEFVFIDRGIYSLKGRDRKETLVEVRSK